MLLDLTHTSHTAARTGIQRVTRSLYAALGDRATAVCHDPFANAWRPLTAAERTGLTAASAAATKRGARWPVSTQLRGRLQAWLTPGRNALVRLPPERLTGGLLVPELFSPAVAQALPALLAAVRGPRVAVFYDAIALKLPELTPRRTVARYPGYLQELRDFDGIAAISAASRTMLLEYWQWLGVKSVPPVEVIGLGVDPAPHTPAPVPTAGSAPVILSVGSIEGRKNHLALLEAAEQLWQQGHRFTLRLVGLAQKESAGPAIERIQAQLSAGRSLRHDGAVKDETVEAAYAECAFTVYPSLMEGFGLPVIESLSRGRPCVCSSQGAIGESAREGGCLMVATPDVTNLASAMRSLLESPSTLARLAETARNRRFKTWSTYADQVASWMRELPRRK